MNLKRGMPPLLALGCLIALVIAVGAKGVPPGDALAQPSASHPSASAIWFPQTYKGVTPTPFPTPDPHTIITDLDWMLDGDRRLEIRGIIHNSTQETVEIDNAMAYFLDATERISATVMMTNMAWRLPIQVLGPEMDVPIWLRYPPGGDGPSENRAVRNVKLIVSGHITSTRVVTLTVVRASTACWYNTDFARYEGSVEVTIRNDSGQTIREPRIACLTIYPSPVWSIWSFGPGDLPSQMAPGETAIAQRTGYICPGTVVTRVWAIGYI